VYLADIVYFADTKTGSSALPQVLLLVAFMAGFYFLLIRPMKRRQQAAAKQAADLRASLEVGDEIVTVGGLYGTVVELDDDTVTLEISPGVTARYDRSAIARTVTAPDASSDADDSAASRATCRSRGGDGC
jgi:preprotein translocase subunit YajC